MATPTYTLLIVEDLPADRERYRRCLLADPSCTYCLLEAESVEEGLELCKTQSIDAVLLDYMLPDADGLEFIRALLAQSNGSSPPVVMVTGEGHERIAVQAIKMGAEDYLVKRDLTPKLLQSMLRSAIENARLRLQLQQCRERFQISVDNMLDCFGIYSAIRDEAGQITDFRFEYLNEAALKSNRMTAADLGKRLCEVFPSTRSGLFEEYCQVVETGEPLVKEDLAYSDVFGVQQLAKAYDVRISKLNDGLVASWRDVTERIQAEQERDRFFNLSLDMLAIASFGGYFLRLNPAWEKILGFTPEELMEQPYLDLVHPEDRAATLAAAQGLSEGQVAIRFENRYRCKDGSYRWLSWSTMPYAEQNLVYAIAHDITEYKRTLAALQERNQELNSFVHVVSHDLKAPLRAITNLSQWIEEDLEERLSAESQENMTLLRSRVHRMEAMIDGLLEYARVGRTAATTELVVVKELLSEVIDSIAPPPTFHIHLAPNLPTLYTKRLWLSQVFANLIGNGVRHHNLLNGCIRISCRDRGDFYEFVVADDGPGIAPEYHNKIFMIFQVGSTQDSQDSSGIGLSIVKKIVEAERGTIRLESKPGKGTTFYFTWPKH